MYIAVAADGQTVESQVSEEFITCRYLLIVDLDSMAVKAIENSGDPLGEPLSHKVNDYNCEVVITGKLTPEAFEILAGDCITRYDGYGHCVKDALVLMDQYKLKLIRNPEGTDDCVGEHSEGSCDENHHDHG